MPYGTLTFRWIRDNARIVTLLCAVVSQGFGIGASIAADDKAISVATRPNLPPYVIGDATSGIEISIVKAIFREMGEAVTFVQMDRVAMIERFEKGEIGGTLTQSSTASSHGCITDWYIVHQNVGFSLARKNMKVNSLADLSTRSVVSFDNAKTFLGDPFKAAMDANPNYREIAPQSRQIGMLYKGAVDVIVGDEWIIRYVQRQHFEKTGEYEDLRLHQILAPTLYSARFQDKLTCSKFNAALKKLRTNGTYANILLDYQQRLTRPVEKASRIQ